MIERKRYRAVCLIHLTVFLVLLVGWFFSGSIALLGDMAHAGIDALAQGIGLTAALIASRDRDYPRGSRIKTLGALVSGMLLIFLGVPLCIAAVRRFINPPEIHGAATLLSALLGLVANYLGLKIYGTGHADVLLRVTRAHLAIDATATIATLASGFLTMVTGQMWWDPLLGMLLGLMFVGCGAYYVGQVKQSLTHAHLTLVKDAKEDDHSGAS